MFVLVVVVFGRAVARFYIDNLWYDGLGRGDVFWTTIRAKLTLVVVFFTLFAALVGVNLAIADRLAPTRFPANVHPYVERFHDVFGRRLRLYRYGLGLLLALMVALPTMSQWQSWLLYRHSRSFGSADAQFGVDVGFYVFDLPFLTFVLDWLFVAMVLVLIVTAVTHVLNGGVVFASPVPSVHPGTRGHLAVLLAVLAMLQAVGYWVRRYETTNERRSFIQGATYSVVHAQLPALMLLAFVAVVTGGLFLASLRTHSWRLPLIASAVWIVLAIGGGYVYPAVVQSLVVNPNQATREAPYIDRNVVATRAAMGIAPDEVAVVDRSFGTLNAAEVESDLQPLRDVRLLNPVEMRQRFRVDQGSEAGLVIDDLDVDRYIVDDDTEQVLVAARELDVAGAGNTSWQGRHLINTRGCGLVMAPAGRVEQSGRPDYSDVELERPELYFSPSLSGYAIARTEASERECGDDESYTGTAGVGMSSWLRRGAFALAFAEYNIVGSGSINGDSQMLWVRNVRDRLDKLAPFLSYDGDPYPVALDGRVVWVVDAYTSTGNYPYAEQVGPDVVLSEASGIPRDANYVRNSVKAVVDAYDGSVQLYIVDPDDPIVQAWASAFPDLFEPGEAMPAELREHLRYPEDLFRVQTNVYSKYQLSPQAFFERDGAWSVAQNPGVTPRSSGTVAVPTNASVAPAGSRPDELAVETSNNRFVPYYTEFPTEDGGNEFVLFRPFVPFSRNDERTQLQAYMTASSDPDTYGQLTVYRVLGDLPDGPRTVAIQSESEPDISKEISLQNQASGGSTVRFGDLQLVPVSDGLLWVRPFYVAVQPDSANATPVTEYRFVIVSYANRAAFDTTIGGALAQLFPGFDADLGERAGGAPVSSATTGGGEPSSGSSGSGSGSGSGSSDGLTPLPGDATANELLARADRLLRDAESQLLVDGDLGAYQDKVDAAAALVEQALDAVGGPPSTEPAAPISASSVPASSSDSGPDPESAIPPVDTTPSG